MSCKNCSCSECAKEKITDSINALFAEAAKYNMHILELEIPDYNPFWCQYFQGPLGVTKLHLRRSK